MKYKNEDLYYYVNNVLNIIKEGLLEKKFRIDSFEDSVVVERLLQKMCGLVIPELGIKAQKEIQNGIKPFSEFNGNLDEISIFSAELTSGQVSTYYNSGVPTDLTGQSNLIHWWRMGWR